MNSIIKILAFVLISLVVIFVLTCMFIIGLAMTKLTDFISYLEDAFIDLFNLITGAIVEFFEIFYVDVYNLIEELF